MNYNSKTTNGPVTTETSTNVTDAGPSVERGATANAWYKIKIAAFKMELFDYSFGVVIFISLTPKSIFEATVSACWRFWIPGHASCLSFRFGSRATNHWFWRTGSKVARVDRYFDLCWGSELRTGWLYYQRLHLSFDIQVLSGAVLWRDWTLDTSSISSWHHLSLISFTPNQ